MKIFIICLIFIFAFLLRIYNIDVLPGEWYGDISNVHEYVTEILAGKWPFYFFQSPGPFYHYFIIPFVLIFRNLGYETYKYSSIIVSLISLFGIYLFAKEIAGKKIALITVLFSGFSLWFLIWSRLGNSQIIIPGEASFSLYFLCRFIKSEKHKDLILAIIIASLGWYTYPQTFVIPVFVFIFSLLFIFFSFRRRGMAIPIFTLFLSFLLFLLPFIFIIKNQEKSMPGNFSSSGYVGSKILPALNMPLIEFSGKIAKNFGKTLLMLHLTGDATFRVNIERQPHIDWFSGVLFFPGLVFMLFSLRKTYVFLIIFSFLVFIFPSISPAIPDVEIPNSARTIAVVPIVYLIVAMGLWQISRIRTGKFIAVILVLIISFTNINDYFTIYSQGLPEDNLGPSRYVSSYIDKNFPAKYKLYFADCCFGAYGQPEPKGIVYSLRNIKRQSFYNNLTKDCSEIAKPAILLVHDDEKAFLKFNNCISDARKNRIYSDNGRYITSIYVLE